MRGIESTAQTTGNQDVHTPALPYCQQLSCWCHTTVAYHHRVTHQQASATEITRAYRFLGLANPVRRPHQRHAREARARRSRHASAHDRLSPGQVYLIHLDQPFRHARHYLGWTLNLERRIAQHRAGTGAKLLRAVNRHGIHWEVVRIWPGGPELEQTLKALKNSPRLCPLCVQAALLHQLDLQPPQEPAEALW
jgi:predicted GIY-YIG superfamily endonuclease